MKLIFAPLMFLSAQAQAQDQTQNEINLVAKPATFASLSTKVFSHECTSCHMVMGPKEPAEAGIDLSSFAAMTASNNGRKNPKHAPFIIAGDPEHSKLYVAVKKGKMPQKEDGSPAPALSAADVQDIYDWIKQGALNN